jgi:hypothetical protein
VEPALGVEDVGADDGVKEVREPLGVDVLQHPVELGADALAFGSDQRLDAQCLEPLGQDCP